MSNDSVYSPGERTHRDDLEKRSPLVIGAVASGCLIILGIIFLLMREHPTPLTVSSFEWKRTIDIEYEKTCHEEDWSIPSGGRKTGEFLAIHHYDRILTGYRTVTTTKRVVTGRERYKTGSKKNKKTGSSENTYGYRDVYGTKTETHQEPVYRSEARYSTMYRYDIERWVYEKTCDTSGNNHDPLWPTLNLTDKERKSGKQTESYSVSFKSPSGKTETLVKPLAEWSTFSEGEICSGVYNGFGVLTRIDRAKQSSPSEESKTSSASY